MTVQFGPYENQPAWPYRDRHGTPDVFLPTVWLDRDVKRAKRPTSRRWPSSRAFMLRTKPKPSQWPDRDSWYTAARVERIDRFGQKIGGLDPAQQSRLWDSIYWTWQASIDRADPNCSKYEAQYTLAKARSARRRFQFERSPWRYRYLSLLWTLGRRP